MCTFDILMSSRALSTKSHNTIVNLLIVEKFQLPIVSESVCIVGASILIPLMSPEARRTESLLEDLKDSGFSRYNERNNNEGHD